MRESVTSKWRYSFVKFSVGSSTGNLLSIILFLSLKNVLFLRGNTSLSIKSGLYNIVLRVGIRGKN